MCLANKKKRRSKKSETGAQWRNAISEAACRRRVGLKMDFIKKREKFDNDNQRRGTKRTPSHCVVCVVVLSLNNEPRAVRPHRCAESSKTSSCGSTARRSPSGACDGRGDRTLPVRWEMRIPITWRYVCRPKIPLSACQNVRKGQIRKKKEKKQWRQALGFHAKLHRPDVSAQRSRRL